MPDHLHLFVRFGQEYEQSSSARKAERLDAEAVSAAIDSAAGDRVSAVTDRRYSGGEGTVAAVCDRRVYDRRGDLHVSPLSSWMKSLKNALSKCLNATDEPPPHWQKGFFDHVMRSAESYAQKWQYVVVNPVRAGLSEMWQEWPWQGEVYALSI